VDGEPLSAPPGAGSGSSPNTPSPPAELTPSAHSAVPSGAEETGPHFFDEDPAPGPAREARAQHGSRPEPAAAWGADVARQSGFGGDQDRRVSWGAPSGPDPRVPRAVEPAPGPARSPGPAQPIDEDVPFAVGPPNDASAYGDSGTPGGLVPDEGTLTFGPRSIAPAAPAPGSPPLPHQQSRQSPGNQGGFQRSAAPAPTPALAPTPVPAPVTGGPGGGQPSWAQQVHHLAGGAGEDGPVVPWRPPVDDFFQAAARRQAAARPAGLGRRLGARLVDTVVLGAVTAAAALPLGTRAADHVNEKIDAAKASGRTVTVWLLDGTTAGCVGAVLAVLILFGVVYEVLPTAKWGRTAGKKLFGVQVRDIEGNEPPAFGAALRRWLVYSVPGLLGVGIVGVLWCLFDKPWQQCWHDKAAHTFVAA
jgi:uncharacterized RDD family membrane protein YckC